MGIQIEKQNNEALNTERERRVNEEARDLLKIKELEQKVTGTDMVCMDLREKLSRSEEKIVELQGEMEGLVEEADEKSTLLREEKEEAKKGQEIAIIDVKDRLGKEKDLLESTLNQDFSMQKRIMSVDFEKQLESEKQKLKLVQQKLDEKCSELVDV